MILIGLVRTCIAEDPEGEPTAFMGIEGDRLEMLFLLPSERGRGGSLSAPVHEKEI